MITPYLVRFLQSKRQRIFVSLAVFVACFVLFLALYPKVMGLITSDDDILADADLSYRLKDVAPSDNMYFDLIHTPTFMGDVKAVEQHNKGIVWDAVFVEKILQQNASMLTVFDRAAKKPAFRDPLLVDLQKITRDTIALDLVNWKNASKLSVLKAGALARAGKGDEALAEALKSVTVGEKIESSAASLVEYFVGMTIKKNGLKASRDVISLTSVSRDTLARYSAALYFSLQNGRASLRSALHAEYLAAKNAVNFSLNSDVSDFLQQNLRGSKVVLLGNDNFYLRPNKTIARIADEVRTLELDIERPCGMAKQRVSSEPSRFGWYFRDNAVGEILADVVVSDMRSVTAKFCEEEFDIAGTRLIFALRIYQLDHGDLPPSLYTLSPQYLSSIPLDPFTGQELKYNTEKRILYSRGMNMEDDGGGEPEVFDVLDPTIEIKF